MIPKLVEGENNIEKVVVVRKMEQMIKKVEVVRKMKKKVKVIKAVEKVEVVEKVEMVEPVKMAAVVATEDVTKKTFTKPRHDPRKHFTLTSY